VESAQDLVQGFFAALIEKHFLLAADPERGRFRTFLLTAFKRYAAKEHEKAKAQKRGGDRVRLSLDFEVGERRYHAEPVDDVTPERLYERRWAVALLEKVLGDLQQEYGSRGKSALFVELRPFLVAGTPTASKAEAAARLGLSPEALRVALHRLRRRYRALLEGAILETLTDPADVTDEIRRLMEALG
jgi:RNA polymerase sigma-70 factor (ECF subfamily)